MELPINKITIPIAQLSDGSYEYHFLHDASKIGLENNFRQAVRVDATLEKNTQQLLIKTSIATAGKFLCDRCTEEFERQVANTSSAMYVYNNSDAEMFPDDEVRVIDVHAPLLDLTADVRELVTLAVPLKLLCKENCKGLCPHCGVNRNFKACSCQEEQVDQRWDGLKKLLNN